MSPKKAICVYCSSSDVVDSDYFNCAIELGSAIARNGFQLVYGGAKVGLMGAVAQAAFNEAGYIIGVIPRIFDEHKLTFAQANELILTQDLRERKAVMQNRSDAFVALPGGFGTLEELLEIITAKQLNFHSAPIVIVNTNGFFDSLLNQFAAIFDQKFAKQNYSQLYFVANDITETIEHIINYKPAELTTKWFENLDSHHTQHVHETTQASFV